MEPVTEFQEYFYFSCSGDILMALHSFFFIMLQIPLFFRIRSWLFRMYFEQFENRTIVYKLFGYFSFILPYKCSHYFTSLRRLLPYFIIVDLLFLCVPENFFQYSRCSNEDMSTLRLKFSISSDIIKNLLTSTCFFSLNLISQAIRVFYIILF